MIKTFCDFCGKEMPTEYQTIRGYFCRLSIVKTELHCCDKCIDTITAKLEEFPK